MLPISKVKKKKKKKRKKEKAFSAKTKSDFLQSSLQTSRSVHFVKNKTEIKVDFISLGLGHGHEQHSANNPNNKQEKDDSYLNQFTFDFS